MLYLLDLFGTAVFAVSGTLAAGRKRMDLFGVLVLATVTAVGGGTLRDMALGATPVFWIGDVSYLAVSSGAALLTVLGARLVRVPSPLFAVADAVGLATFTVAGTQKALSLGVAPGPAIVMGMMSGVVGGMIRDLLAGEVPLVLRREIYATACIAGAVVFVNARQLGLAQAPAAALGAATVLVLRLAAIRWQLSLPVFAREAER